MELFEYINGTLATISERLNNMAKATDMNLREAAVVGEQVVLEPVEKVGVLHHGEFLIEKAVEEAASSPGD